MTDYLRPTRDADAAVGTSRPYPKSIAYLIEERPLLWYEDPGEYDQLRQEFFAELKPQGALNAIFVKNVVDCMWELRRMKKMRHTVINYAMPAAATKLLTTSAGLWGDPNEAEIRKQAEAAAYDAEATPPDFKDRMHSKRVTHEVIHYNALISKSDEFHWISRECERLESRLHRLINDYEARNARLAAMAKTLVDREKAEVVAFKEVN